MRFFDKITSLSKSKLFLIYSVVFIASIAISSFLPSSIIKQDIFWFGGVVFCAILLCLFYQIKLIKFFSLLGLFLFLAFWRFSISIPDTFPNNIWFYNGQEVVFRGIINKEPDIRKNSQKLEIKIKSIKLDSNQFKKVSGKVLVTTNLYPKFNYSDNLEVVCNLKKPEKFNGFWYDRYLARFDIYSVCYYPNKIISINEKETSGGLFYFYKNIYFFKNKLREKIEYGMSDPVAGLTKATILGDKNQISDELQEDFSQVGLSHIIAISGMHISIIAGILMIFLLEIGLSRRKSFCIASIFLFIYVLLIGFPASAIRAMIMGFLFLLALNSGRLNKLNNSLFFSAVILLLINPRLLRDDIGFQLSFLAVFGIALIYPLLDGLFDKFKIPKLYGARDIINITISAQVFTLPIIAINFSQVSLIVILSNLLVVWTFPIFMIATIVALFLSFIFPVFGVVFFLPSAIILKYVIMIATLLSRAPLAYVKIYYIWWGWIVAYYLIVGIIVYLSSQKKLEISRRL